MRLSDALGTTVLSRDDAHELGRVRHLVVDVEQRRVTALHIDGRKKKALLVDWEALTGFGPDAVVVGPGDALRGPVDDAELMVVSGDRDWIGRRVLTDRGNGAGTVTDLEFDEGTGTLASLVTDEATLDSGRLLTLGPYCVVVREHP